MKTLEGVLVLRQVMVVVYVMISLSMAMVSRVYNITCTSSRNISVVTAMDDGGGGGGGGVCDADGEGTGVDGVDWERILAHRQATCDRECCCCCCGCCCCGCCCCCCCCEWTLTCWPNCRTETLDQWDHHHSLQQEPLHYRSSLYPDQTLWRHGVWLKESNGDQPCE